MWCRFGKEALSLRLGGRSLFKFKNGVSKATPGQIEPKHVTKVILRSANSLFINIFGEGRQ